MPGAGFVFLALISIEFAISSEWGGRMAPFSTRQLVRTTERSPMVTRPADCTFQHYVDFVAQNRCPLTSDTGHIADPDYPGTVDIVSTGYDRAVTHDQATNIRVQRLICRVRGDRIERSHRGAVAHFQKSKDRKMLSAAIVAPSPMTARPTFSASTGQCVQTEQYRDRTSAAACS